MNNFSPTIKSQQNALVTIIHDTIQTCSNQYGAIDTLLNLENILDNSLDVFTHLLDNSKNSKKNSYYIKIQEKVKYLSKSYDSNELYDFLCEKFKSELCTYNIKSIDCQEKNWITRSDLYHNIEQFITTKIVYLKGCKNGRIINLINKLLVTFFNSSNEDDWKKWSQISMFFQVKTNKPNNQLQNIRPIAKLPGIVRVMEKSLAIALKRSCNTIIDRNMQSSPMSKNGHLGYGLNHNCFQLEDFIQSKKKGIALFFDIQKAYSSVQHGRLFKILKETGKSTDIVTYIKNYYRRASYKVDDKNVYIRKGLLQGSPISNYLFILYMDAFLKEVKKRLELLDVLSDMFYGKDHSIKAFVDDIVIYCPKNYDIAFTVCMVIRAVAKKFRFALNDSKSRVLCNDGSKIILKNNDSIIPSITIGDKYLGRYLAYATDEMAEIFIEHCLDPLINIIRNKKYNKLRYYLKSVGSRIMYMFTKTAAPPSFLTILSAYEWSNLIEFGMKEEDISEYLYSRNHYFITERRHKLMTFLDIGIDTPYINEIKDDFTDYTEQPVNHYMNKYQDYMHASGDDDYSEMEDQ